MIILVSLVSISLALHRSVAAMIYT